MLEAVSNQGEWMSYELVAILISGVVQVMALAFIAIQVRESIRVSRAVAGLVAQESEGASHV